MEGNITTNSRNNSPKTKKQLIQYIIKEIGRNTTKKLLKSLVISIILFVINVVLISNFSNTDNEIISSLLVQPGNIIGGTLLWSIIGVIIINIKNTGFVRAFSSIKTIIGGISSYKTNENKKFYIIGLVTAFILSLIIGNIMLSAVVAFTFMSSLQSKDSSLIYVLRVFFSKSNTHDNSEKITNGVKGASLSLAIYTLFGSSSFGLGLSVALVFIFLIVSLKSKRQRTSGGIT